MSCTLYLLRHGIAVERAPGRDDRDRALTPDGARKVREVAAGLAGLGIVADVVLSSPLRRAHETATLVAAGLEPTPELALFEPLEPGTPPTDVLRALRRYRDAGHVFLVGHEPDLGRLASFLLTGAADTVPLPFKKSGMAAIEVRSLPPRTAGTLHWFAPPKLLRRR